MHPTFQQQHFQLYSRSVSFFFLKSFYLVVQHNNNKGEVTYNVTDVNSTYLQVNHNTKF